jgi:hypothetical protein
MLFLPPAIIHDGQPVRLVAAEVQVSAAKAEAPPVAFGGWTLAADDTTWAPGSVGAPSPGSNGTGMNQGSDTNTNPSGQGTQMNRDTSGGTGTTRGGTDTQASPVDTGASVPGDTGSNVPGKDGNPTPAAPTHNPSLPYDSPGAGRPETSAGQTH